MRVRVRSVGTGTRGKHLPALIPLQSKHSATLIGCRLAEWVERAWGCGELALGHQPSGILPGEVTLMGMGVEVGSGSPGGTKVGSGARAVIVQ